MVSITKSKHKYTTSIKYISLSFIPWNKLILDDRKKLYFHYLFIFVGMFGHANPETKTKIIDYNCFMFMLGWSKS